MANSTENNKKRDSGGLAGILVGIFTVYLSVAFVTGKIRPEVGYAIAILNCLTFSVYCIDKFAAQRGNRRIPEHQLCLLALLGGWPGAWVAQKLTRHKTVKASFQRAFLACVMLNFAAFILYSSPWAREAVLNFVE